jgi:L-aminopeptidase/D-esterase-like protein
MRRALAAALTLGLLASTAAAQGKARARELGLDFGGVPGTLDAITDVAGVEVGHTTLIEGEGRLVRGKGPVRTGVTVVHPRGRAGTSDPVMGAWFTLNGNGEMTGTTWLQESGFLEGPIAITNTGSVGVVHDAILAWQVGKETQQAWGLPIAAETYDGVLNDLEGFHVRQEHVLRALEGARGGAVPEGNVGGGTGMICHGFKGGIGTASRVVDSPLGRWTVGVLVQCNYGARRDLSIAGVPVGQEIPDLEICVANADSAVRGPFGITRRCAEVRSDAAPSPRADRADAGPWFRGEDLGSIIIVVATDAPLLPHQLKRIATRAALGVGRMGGRGGDSSGDIFVAFSTANPGAAGARQPTSVSMLPNGAITPLFAATVQATEAAITNAMLAAETMTGANDVRVYALPHDRLRAAMRKYGR